MHKDPIPDYSNRLATWLSLIFHPYVIYVVPAVITLGLDGLRWSLLILLLVVLPISVTVLLQARQRQFVYERGSRTPLYIVGWIGVVICWFVSRGLGAPDTFTAGVASIAVWAPIQFVINTFFTKASVHAALVAMSVTGLLLLGYLNTWPALLAALIVIVAASWARMVTRNHTLTQILLGLFTGVLAVVIVFSLSLPPSR